MVDLPYPPSRYDETFHLRLTPFLALVIFWSLHPALMLVGGTFSRSGPIFVAVLEYAYNLESLLSCVPGAMVLLAYINRGPKAGDWTRRIWRHGRALLALGMAMHFGTVLWLHWKEVADLNEAMLASLLVSAVFFAGVLAFRYHRDLFADFPDPEPDKK